MPTQVQIRGTTQATQEARTLVSRELDVNTNLSRLAVHDGSTPGGVQIPNCFDIQNQQYTYAQASGTDTIVANYAKAPASYVAGQRFTFRSAATNTGTCTININSLGAKTIKKKNVSGGTLDIMNAGDIISGGIYTVFYDGSDMLIEAIDGGGLQSVSQGDLNTSSASVSSVSEATELTLPGGEYGFLPQYKASSSTFDCYPLHYSAGGTSYRASVRLAALPNGGDSRRPLYQTPDTNGNGRFTWCSAIDDANNFITRYARQRYVTSSPPFDMGDGDANGFVYALVDSNGDIHATYIADVPPWGYNGPTKIGADAIDRATGKKYRKTREVLSVEQIMDGVKPGVVYEEITQSIKNNDMGLIPHPFGLNLPKGHTVVLLDPMDKIISSIIEEEQHIDGIDFSDLLYSKKIKIDNDKLKRKGPKGVTISKFKL